MLAGNQTPREGLGGPEWCALRSGRSGRLVTLCLDRNMSLAGEFHIALLLDVRASTTFIRPWGGKVGGDVSGNMAGSFLALFPSLTRCLPKRKGHSVGNRHGLDGGYM